MLLQNHYSNAFLESFPHSLSRQKKKTKQPKPLFEFQEVSNYNNFMSVPEKDRYPDVVPYAHNRVVLSCDDEGSDYINASYVLERFIATQAPLSHTVCDFWKMVYEQRVVVIVMLTRVFEGGCMKASFYWPIVQDVSVAFGEVSVTLLKQEEEGSLLISKFRISGPEEDRIVYHIQYLGWPDKGVPESGEEIISIIEKAHQFNDAVSCGTGRIIVHCSAGIGRTGTFIAIYEIIELLKKDHNAQIDVESLILRMREHRCGMVQTDAQFEFIQEMVEICREQFLKKSLKYNGKHLMPLTSSSETVDNEIIAPLSKRRDWRKTSGPVTTIAT